MIIKDLVSEVAEQHSLGREFFLLAFRNDHIARHALPGHFLMVSPAEPGGPLLRRPFGILEVNPPKSSVWIYYQRVGSGTGRLSSLKPGDSLRVLGPLGNGFQSFSGRRILLVAGGRGIAPLIFAARRLAAGNRVVLLYGAPTAAKLHLRDRIRTLDLADVRYCTEDGSLGSKGMVTDHIGEIVDRHRIDVTLSCGPDAMFQTLQRQRDLLPAENYVSAEALMGCGFGICHSCVVATDAGYRQVCSDGPVFTLESLKWQT